MDLIKVSEFIKWLFFLYCYMIWYKNEELVLLEEEWRFLVDYIYLLE